MSRVANQKVTDQIDLGGWVIESKRSHYSIGYWVMFVLGMFGQMVPPAPRITYTLRNPASNECRWITLPGDHSSSDLAEAARSGSSPGVAESNGTSADTPTRR